MNQHELLNKLIHVRNEIMDTNPSEAADIQQVILCLEARRAPLVNENPISGLISNMIRTLQNARKKHQQGEVGQAWVDVHQVILILQYMSDAPLSDDPQTPLVNENPTKREQILQEAIKCVTKDRNATHGDPEDNFMVIADFWTTYLKMKGKLSNGLDSTDVAILMVLMKVSRTITSPEHMDHWTDIAGYAACGGGIATKVNS